MSDVPHDPRPLVWVVGDAMIDETLPAAATRFAQEDPAVPVLAVGEARRVQPGGAANVAANLVAMGCRARLFTSAHLDPDGLMVLEGLAAEYGFDLDVTKTRRPGRVTVKTRVTVGGRLAARIDRDPVGPLDPARPPADPAEAPAALVFCDHAKGAVGAAEDIEKWVRAAAGCPSYLDPHPSRWRVYAGLRRALLGTVVPNRDEASVLTGAPVSCASAEDVVAAALAVCNATQWAQTVCLKLGECGSVYLVRGLFPSWDRAATPAAVYDLQGAGDTFLAGLVSSVVLRGFPPDLAPTYANAAAAVAVSRPGTAVVDAAAITEAMRPTVCAPIPWDGWVSGDCDVVRMWLQVLNQVERVRRIGLKVGFTNGCFDLIHPGHIRILHRAAEQCDFLVVGVDSDARVIALKGAGRPVVAERDRAAQVATVRGVGGVFVFDSDPDECVRQLRPDVMFKGDEYRGRFVSGSALLPQWGGRLVLVPMFEGHSTTARVARARGEDGPVR